MSDASRGSATGRSRHALLAVAVAAFVVFIGGALASWRFAPLADPYQPLDERSWWQWLTSPVERNAFLRLPLIGTDLTSVFALPGTLEVWAVGEDLILHSSDGGETWERQDDIDWNAPTAAPQDSPPAERAEAAGLFRGFSFMSSAVAAVSPLSPSELAEGQQLLTALGFYKGRTDGVEDDNTLAAVRLFQQDENLAADGVLGQQTLDVLRKVAAGRGLQVGPPAGFSVDTPPPTAQQSIVEASPSDSPIAEEPEAASDRPLAHALHDIAFGDRNTGVAVGEAGLLFTADGGATWRLSYADSQLRSVAFATPNRAIAVGDNARMLGTVDGGATWTPRDTAEQSGPFLDVAFGDARYGIVVGYGGALRTDDGGETWRETELSGALNAIAFADAQRATSIDLEDGSLWGTVDAGRTWSRTAQTSGVAWVAFAGPNNGFAGVYDSPTFTVSEDGGATWSERDGLEFVLADTVVFSGAEHGIAAGRDGQLLRSTDGGLTWSQQTAPSFPHNDIAFTDGGRGVTVSDFGRILLTADGGTTWSPVRSGTFAALRSVAIDGEFALAGGQNQTLLVSDDAGYTWSMADVGGGVSSEVGFGLVAVRGSDGIAVDGIGQTYVTADGGRRWSPSSDLPAASAMAFAADRVATSMDTTNVVARTNDGGSNWTVSTDDEQEDGVKAIAFSPDGTGIVTSRSGYVRFSANRGTTWGPSTELEDPRDVTLLSAQHALVANGTGVAITTDGAQTWTETPMETGLALVAGVDERRAAAIDIIGSFLVTDDGGKTWQPLEYSRYPAPLFTIFSVAALLLGLFAARRAWENVPTDERKASVTDVFASDRPLRPGERDALGLGAIAAGISRFLRNRSTEPPLTIAISGEWGSGKSSLMGLLHDDLEKRGFRPVWFNAWHHQRGEQLLASLYANIRAQGLPSWLTPEGWAFRWNLLMMRIHQYWFRLCLTLLVSVFAFVYMANHDGWRDLLQLLDSGTDDEQSMQGVAAWLSTFVPLLAAIVPPLFGAYRALRAFGLHPKTLLGTVSTRQDGELTAQPGVRFRFAEEFREVTAALKPRALVIFIDDLDRCEQEHVLEVLETINFLVSAGDCYIVLGMSRRWVETCVGLAFKELAAETPEVDDTSAPDSDTRAERRRFARQYLEKLINIEVPIPKVTDKTSAALLEPAEFVEPTWLVRAARAAAKAARPLGLAALLAVVVSTAWVLGKSTPDFAIPSTTAGTPDPATATSTPGETPAPGPGNAPIAEPQPESASPVPVFAAGALDTTSSRFHLALGALGVLGLAALVGVLLMRRAQAQTNDSPAFRKALGVMRPWILLGHPTPRLLKRYMNHIRFIAMRQRADDEPLSVLDALANRARRALGLPPRAAPAQTAPSALPEPLLVAWSALHQANSDWQNDPQWLAKSYRALGSKDFTNVVGPDRADPTGRGRLITALDAALAAFNEHKDLEKARIFQDEAADLRAIDLLLTTMGGISVDSTSPTPTPTPVEPAAVGQPA